MTASFSDMPAAFLRSVAESLWEDGKELASLIATCKGVRAVCDEPDVWKKLVTQRFGNSVVPGVRSTAEGERSPKRLEGWLFYQGRDASEESDQQQHWATDIQQLAQLAQGADAFTTTGKVIRLLRKPQSAWTHSSFLPREGMYVKADVVQQQGLQEPQQQQEGSVSPFEVPGWQYFPCCVSDGYSLAGGESRDSLARFTQLTQVLEACRGNQQAVAVTSEGEVKSKLRPQSCWEVDPSSDIGLYVKTSVVSQLQLEVPPAVPDYRALYAKLDKLQLDAGNMRATWLNDHYLQLAQDSSSPAESGMVLQLNSVWWLDVGGSIAGVPPGSYEVCWVVDVSDMQWYDGREFSMSAEAHATHPADTNSGINCPASSSSINSSSNMGPTTAASIPSVTVLYSSDVIQQLKQQCRQHSARWGIISAGTLQVRQYSTVHLRFWSHENTFKRGMRWACVQLRPLDSLREQENVGSQSNVVRVWSPEVPRQNRTASSSGAAADRAAIENAEGLQHTGNFTAAGSHHHQQQALPIAAAAAVAQQLMQYMGWWNRWACAADR